MRAFYIHQWILHSNVVKATTGMDLTTVPWLSTGLLMWCTACGWARVAAGRHYPTDVFVGAIVGYALGSLIEIRLDNVKRYTFKCFAGVIVATQAWFYLLQPILTQLGVRRSFIHVLRFCFFAFYLKALFSAVVLPVYDLLQHPNLDVRLGEFSYFNEGNSYVCRNLW